MLGVKWQALSRSAGEVLRDCTVLQTSEVEKRFFIHQTCLCFRHFRDRSIPELDEILDAKLSEVQDHMRTLMQKQVSLGVCQPPSFHLDFAVAAGYFTVWVTGRLRQPQVETTSELKAF